MYISLGQVRRSTLFFTNLPIKTITVKKGEISYSLTEKLNYVITKKIEKKLHVMTL